MTCIESALSSATNSALQEQCKEKCIQAYDSQVVMHWQASAITRLISEASDHNGASSLLRLGHAIRAKHSPAPSSGTDLADVYLRIELQKRLILVLQDRDAHIHADLQEFVSRKGVISENLAFSLISDGFVAGAIRRGASAILDFF